jgi:hypothetical protein
MAEFRVLCEKESGDENGGVIPALQIFWLHEKSVLAVCHFYLQRVS